MENESDYHQSNWKKDLIHKHSPAGKREKKIRGIKMRGKKWYAKKGIVSGLLLGFVFGLLVFMLTMRRIDRIETTPEPTRAGYIDTSIITPVSPIILTGEGS